MMPWWTGLAAMVIMFIGVGLGYYLAVEDYRKGIWFWYEDKKEKE